MHGISLNWREDMVTDDITDYPDEGRSMFARNAGTNITEHTMY
jgi:hypothetical protein